MYINETIKSRNRPTTNFQQRQLNGEKTYNGDTRNIVYSHVMNEFWIITCIIYKINSNES